MSEQRFAYPRQEHYTFPRTPYEQIDDELRLYPDGLAFRLYAYGLVQMYGETPFMKSMVQCSRLVTPLRVSTTPSNSPGSANYGFHDGSLLALHMNVAPARKRVKKFVLNQQLYPDPEDIVGTEQAKVLMELWQDDEEHSCMEFLDSQPEEFKSSMFKVSERLYEGWDDIIQREYDFVLGYSYATKVMQSLIDTMPAHL